jgi:hypothetical protein
LYSGEPVAFALHDALLDAEQPILAEHFAPVKLASHQVLVRRSDGCTIVVDRSILPVKFPRFLFSEEIGEVLENHCEPHPKGCWALDIILGRE